MKSRPPADRHLDVRTVLDFLDGWLAEPGRREVEEHLARPCAACRECVRELGALLHLMRLDRLPPVPEALRERALGAFAPTVRPSRVAPALEQLARLLFDSMAAPLPAPGGTVRRSWVRHAVGEARRLGFALGEGRLELECEPEAAGLVSLRGRLLVEDAPLHRIEVAVGTESRAAWPDAEGAFAIDDLPAGEVRLAIVGPEALFRFPPILL